MNYLYIMDNIKPLTKEAIYDHVCYLKKLKQENKLILAGPLTDYPGGLIVFSAKDQIEAYAIVQSDPFIKEGYKSFVLRTIELADESNNYLLG